MAEGCISGAGACLQRGRQDTPIQLVAPTVTRAQKHMHIQRTQCATAVARAGTHTRTTAVAQAWRTPLPLAFGHHILLAGARLSRGLAHISSAHRVLTLQSRSLCGVVSLRARRPTSGRYTFCALTAHTCCHCGGVHAGAGRWLLHCGGARRAASLGINQSSPQSAVAPARGGRGSQVVHRYSGLATLMKAGAAGSTAVDPAQAQPLRWRGPVKQQPCG